MSDLNFDRDALLNAHTRLLEQILEQLKQLQGALQAMALDITALTNAVAAEETVEAKAIATLQAISAELQNLINSSGNTVDPAALQALVDRMNASQGALAAAIAAVPPAPPAPPPPTP